MIKIYHNPRCSKSRAALERVRQFAADEGEALEVIEYLKTPPDAEDLVKIHAMLGVPAQEMIRHNEEAYESLGLSSPAHDNRALFGIVAANPILLQRPIVIRDGRAVIARSPDAIEAILS